MNSSSEVTQWLRPPETKRRSAKVNVPQSTLAYFADISDAKLSVYLSGRAGLSEEAQEKLEHALEFCEWLAERAGKVPVDFRNIPALGPFFKEFKKLSAASEVVGTNAE